MPDDPHVPPDENPSGRIIRLAIHPDLVKPARLAQAAAGDATLTAFVNRVVRENCQLEPPAVPLAATDQGGASE